MNNVSDGRNKWMKKCPAYDMMDAYNELVYAKHS